MSNAAIVPEWVVPPVRQVIEMHYVAYRLAEEVRLPQARGVLAAMEWVTGGQAAPVTGLDGPVTQVAARAESWVALCVAAGVAPSASDWGELGVQPRAATTQDAELAHWTWRTLAWLLGARRDPPVELPRRDAEGKVAPGEERYVTRPEPESEGWRAAQARRREYERADARRHWEFARTSDDGIAGSGVAGVGEGAPASPGDLDQDDDEADDTWFDDYIEGVLARHDPACVANAVDDAYAHGIDVEQQAREVAAQLLESGESECLCAVAAR